MNIHKVRSNNDLENSERSTIRAPRKGRPVRLLLGAAVIFLIGGICTYLVMRFVLSKEDRGGALQAEEEPIGVLRSLTKTDAQVEERLLTLKNSHSAAELSYELNARGYRIYLAEKARAEANNNSYSREEVQRALRWFEKARQLDANAELPPWNAACMYGLLGNVDEAIRRLDNLSHVLPPGRKVEYGGKISPEKDFCPIERDPVFKNYLEGTWKIQRNAICPEPAIHTP